MEREHKSTKNRYSPMQQMIAVGTLFFVLGYLLGAIYGFSAGVEITSRASSELLDQYFATVYTNEIKPEAEKEIDTILHNVEMIENDTEKLNTIAEWTTANFTEYFWEKYQGNDVNWSSLGYPFSRYNYDKSARVRALNSGFDKNLFSNDPYWIAHYRIGACGELAHLFEFVTNKSGYETQIIVIEFEGNNHAWVELVIDGEWKYFDPTIYGEYHNGISSNSCWFGEREEYPYFQGQVTSISNVKTKEDMSEYYPQLVYNEKDENEKIQILKLPTVGLFV